MTSLETSRLTHRAEAGAISSPFIIDGMPEQLQLTQLDSFAGAYEEMAAHPRYQKEDGTGPDTESINEKIESTINTYLESAGIETEPETDEQRREYEIAFSAVERAIRTNKADWIGHTTESGHESVSNQVFRDLLAHYNPYTGRHRAEDPATASSEGTEPGESSDSHDEDEPVAELTPEQQAEFAELEAKLDELREKWATESAKRQGRMWSFKTKQREELYKEYQAAAAALGVKHMELHEDWSDEDRKLIATALVFDEQEKLRTLTTEKLQGTKVSKIIEFMNRGSKLTRIAKGIGVGAVAGVAGSFMAGLAGAAVVTTGVVALTRFARGFAIKDKDQRGMASFDDVVDGDQLAEGDWSTQQKYANSSFERGTQIEQNKRAKAGIYGVGSIAVGSLLGYGIHEGAEWLSGKDLELVDWASDRWNNFWNGADDHVVPGHQPETGKWGAHNDFDGDGKLNGVDFDKDGDGVLNVDDYKPHDSTIWDAPQTPKLENPYFKWHIDANGVQQDNAADVFHDLLGYNKGHVTPEWLGQLADKAGVDWTPGHTLVFEGHLNDEANAQLKQMLEYAQQHNLKP